MEKKTFAELFPELLCEWNYDMNHELDPSMVSAHSNKKVWWKCSSGHEWLASIGNRTGKNHTGCPYCSGKKVVSGVNDLATINPNLSKEWDYDKNGELRPSMVSARSSRKVWWICKYGHEWQATVNDRSNNHGCPQCAKFIPGVSDLFSDNPSLASQWDYDRNAPLTPENVACRSRMSVWWIGPCGHQWKAQICERNRKNRNGSGCPICNRNSRTSLQEQIVFYYIKQAFPDAINGDRRLSLELDIFIPSINTAIEYDGFLWHSSSFYNHSLTDERKNKICKQNGIRLIRILEPQLPVYDNCICYQREDMSDNCLERIIIQLCGFLSDNKINITPDITRDRQSILSMYETATKENSVGALFPDLAKEWHPTKNGTLQPENLTVNSGQKVWWKCSVCGYEWEGSVHARTNKNRKMNGCPVCAGTIVIPGLNDFESAYPEIAKEWHPTRNKTLMPNMITRGSHRKVWWLGNCGHEWQTELHHRINGSGCPYCANKLVLHGFNDLATTNPELIKEWDPENMLSPYDVTVGSAQLVSWICSKGHHYKSPIKTRKRSGCPYCAGKKILVGYNDISTRRPDLVEIWHHQKNGGVTPQTLTEHSNKKVWFICNKGHEWQACPNSMKNNSCPYCNNRKVLRGYNDLCTIVPSLLKEWDYEKNIDVLPEELSYRSTKKVWWRCSNCSFEWESSVYNRSIMHTGCPKCVRR